MVATILTEEQREALLRDYQEGVTLKAMQLTYRIVAPTIRRIVAAAGLPPRTRRVKFENRDRSQDAAILEAYTRGDPYDDICAQFGTTKNTIQLLRVRHNLPTRRRAYRNGMNARQYRSGTCRRCHILLVDDERRGHLCKTCVEELLAGQRHTNGELNEETIQRLLTPYDK